MQKGCFPAILLVALTASLLAIDWPVWRGPGQDNISPEKDWTHEWDGGKPKQLWETNVGLGFGSMAVANKRLYTMGHDTKETTTLYCIDISNGKTVWEKSWEAPLGDKYFEGGALSTPVIEGNRLYLLGRFGKTLCLDAATGKPVWEVSVVDDLGHRLPTWGFSSAPVISGEKLLLNVGEHGICLDRDTGKPVWQSPKRSSGYSTPVLYTENNKTYAVFSSEKQYAAVNIATGEPHWTYRWLTRYGVNSTDPIITKDGHAFISTGYGKGAAYLKLFKEDPETLWKSRDYNNQLSTSLLIDGYLYGVHGDTTQKASIRCVDVKTGDIQWTHENFGNGNLLAANGKLLCLSATGELLIAPVSHKSFSPVAKAQAIDGKCWSAPVLSDGRLYCRNSEGSLVCLDLQK
jgi:outer membrane protein assembly factor BamB